MNDYIKEIINGAHPLAKKGSYDEPSNKQDY